LCTFLDEQVGKVLAALESTGLAGNTRVLYTSDHGDNLGARGLWGKSTLYQEAAAVPLIVAGDGLPAGRVVDEHVSHVDFWPFVFEATGAPVPGSGDYTHPGISLAALAHGARPDRTVLSEYHGMGSTTGAFMVRLDRYKYVHYVDYPAQFFDLREDPEELVDRARDPAMQAPLREAHARLTSMLDPAQIDARAKARQAQLLASNGGREAVIARGDLGFSVPPGVTPMFD
jgi:choline-sulfatase